MIEARRAVVGRTRRLVAPALAALLLVVPATSASASSVGGPVGPPYDDAAACTIPWLAPDASAIIEGITVRAVSNTSYSGGMTPSEGLYLHAAAQVGDPDSSTTVLTFDPALEALEVTVTELIPGDPSYASESYRLVGSPGSGADVLDWTLTDENAQVSGTFDPGIATLAIAYGPSVSPDTLLYGAYVRLRIPRVGETCDVEDAPPPRDRETDDPDEALPVPLAVPSGLAPSGGTDGLPDRGAATVSGALAVLALLAAGAGGERRVGRRGA